MNEIEFLKKLYKIVYMQLKAKLIEIAVSVLLEKKFHCIFCDDANENDANEIKLYYFGEEVDTYIMGIELTDSNRVMVTSINDYGVDISDLSEFSDEEIIKILKICGIEC